MRLIDADELKDRMAIIINSAIDGDETAGQLKLLSMIKYVLDTSVNETPTIEAEPVRHGHVEPDGEGYLRCSVCSEHESYLLYYKYCPNCGAKMDGGTENA